MAVLDGCFKNTSILESLNMSSTFDFANDIDFSGTDEFDISSAFSLDGFDTLYDNIMLLGYKNFTYDESLHAANPTVKQNIDEAIAWIQANLTEIRDDLSAYEIELENFQTRLKLAATNVKPMVTSIVTLATNLRCSWIVSITTSSMAYSAARFYPMSFSLPLPLSSAPFSDSQWPYLIST